MNILSNEQMREKEQELLELYAQSEIKLRIDLEELVGGRRKGRDLFCFRRVEESTRVWIQKLVPLSKKIQCINLQQQQNGLFKALTFIFLFIIYKPQPQSHQYLKQHIKCSLYSSDIDLLQIRNHSFNKRMKSDTIKSVMATFLQELDIIIHNNKKGIKIEELLGSVLQKNDIIVEGFHLFYRSLLAKLQVENAGNCMEEVGVEEAVENLLGYLEVDCRQFSNLYLFNEANLFLAILQDQLVFGRYYQNQSSFQQTSEQQSSQHQKQQQQQHLPTLPQQNRFTSIPSQQLTNDLKVFNFALDSDRNQSLPQQQLFQLKSNEAMTPCFVGNQEMRFGRKKSLESNGEMHASFNKFKDRLMNEKINQIQSEEEDFQLGKRQSGKFGQVNDQSKNRFLNLEDGDDSDHFKEDDNMAPTPMLGGNQMFHFGLKSAPSQKPQPKSPPPSISPKNSQNHQPLAQTKQLISTAIRRQSYQGDNSSQSKSSDNRKKQMKTSKNQIKVIDQTASRVSLVKIAQESPRKVNFPGEEDFVGDRKYTVGQCEKVSSYSNCTCHAEKRARIKLNSNTVEVNIQQSDQVQRYPPVDQRKVSQDSMDFVGIKKEPLSYEKKVVFFKSNANKSTDDLLKAEDKRTKSPAKQTKQPKDQHKRQQFINFLKKDKTELIKKLSEKRHAKNNVTSGQLPSSKADQTKTTQATRKFVKQSMFVGSYNFQNPEKLIQGKNDGDRAVTHGRSMEKQIGVRQRSKTPTQPKLANPFQTIRAPYPQQSRKQSIQISTAINFKSNCVTMQQNQQPIIPKPQISFKVPLPANQPPGQQNIQWISSQNSIKPYEFYLKREK